MTDVAASETKVQQESIQYNRPVGESSTTAIAALANFLREVIQPVGTVMHSMLSESDFQTQNGNPSPERWVLADGRSVAGSAYQTLTGSSTIPDLRGVFIRGKNGARSGSTGNPDGDLSLGAYQADQFLSHNHGFSDPGHAHGMAVSQQFRSGSYASGSNFGAWDETGPGATQSTTSVGTGISFSSNGGNESRARNVTLNPFIRIN